MSGEFGGPQRELSLYLLLKPGDAKVQARLRAEQPVEIYRAMTHNLIEWWNRDPSDQEGWLRVEDLRRASLTLPMLPPVPDSTKRMLEQAQQSIKTASNSDALTGALGQMEQVIGNAPWWADAYYDVARIQEMQDKPFEAAMYLKRYLELKPGDTQARAHLADLEKKIGQK